MPTPLENLESRHAYLCERLAELEDTDAGELPNVRGEGEIDHGELKQRILNEIKTLDEQIERIRGREVWSEVSRVV